MARNESEVLVSDFNEMKQSLSKSSLELTKKDDRILKLSSVIEEKEKQLIEHIKESQDEMKSMMEKQSELQKEKNEAKADLRQQKKQIEESQEKFKKIENDHVRKL